MCPTGQDGDTKPDNKQLDQPEDDQNGQDDQETENQDEK